MNSELPTLDAEGLLRFQALQADAVNAVTDRFYATHGSVYERFGERGRQACREDLAFHLEFLRPVLQFGLLQPMVDYLTWLNSVLEARSIPASHLAQSLEWLADFFGENMDGAEAGIVTTALMQARTAFLDAEGQEATPPTPPEAWPEAAPFEAALLSGDQGAALAIVNQALDDGHDLVDVELHIMRTALYHIGEMWQANQVSVAQEHMASAIVQSVMTLALLRCAPPPKVGRRALLACVEGNNHAIGLRMVADAFQLAGWDIQYLGANVPTTALVQQITEWEPALVCLSISFAHQLPVAKEVMARLQAAMGTGRPSVIVGGLAFRKFQQLSAFVGADSCIAYPRDAVDAANRLVAA